MRPTAAIILAAGLSRRMGTAKLLLPIDGAPMLQRTLDLVAAFPFARTILVTIPMVAQKVKTSAQVIINPTPEAGQSSSLRLGVLAANLGESLLFLTGDQPFLDRETLSAILEADDGQSIAYPETAEGLPRNPTLFAPRFRAELLALTGDIGGRQLRNRHPEACRPVQVPDEKTLMDVDTPEEYQTVLRMIERNIGGQQ